jgi:hypothetical protein
MQLLYHKFAHRKQHSCCCCCCGGGGCCCFIVFVRQEKNQHAHDMSGLNAVRDLPTSCTTNNYHTDCCACNVSGLNELRDLSTSCTTTSHQESIKVFVVNTQIPTQQQQQQHQHQHSLLLLLLNFWLRFV